MHLSPEEFVQLDDSYLLALEQGRLRALSVTLLVDIKDAFEGLAQKPSNSSGPPSNRAPWEEIASTEPSSEDAAASGAASAA